MAVSFVKTPLNYNQQLELLESRGLTVSDRAFALHCLQHLNYYRLSAYRFPLTVMGDPDRFLAGVTFDDLWKLYEFDQNLHRMVLDASKRIEVSVRAHWAYVVGVNRGPFSYEDSTLFADQEQHLRGLGKLYNDLAGSREDFVKHFRNKYGLTRPPIWAVCEVLSFGQISHFCKNLREHSLRKAIADPYGVDEKVLISYLHHLTVVRNHAAHHGRLWNRNIVVKFTLPKKPLELNSNFTTDPAAEKKIYNTLTMLLHLLSVIDPKSEVPPLLYKLVDELEDRYHSQMGLPADWRDRTLWKAQANARL